jgi:hypothetical protein
MQGRPQQPGMLPMQAGVPPAMRPQMGLPPPMHGGLQPQMQQAPPPALQPYGMQRPQVWRNARAPCRVITRMRSVLSGTHNRALGPLFDMHKRALGPCLCGLGPYLCTRAPGAPQERAAWRLCLPQGFPMAQGAPTSAYRPQVQQQLPVAGGMAPQQVPQMASQQHQQVRIRQDRMEWDGIGVMDRRSGRCDVQAGGHARQALPALERTADAAPDDLQVTPLPVRHPGGPLRTLNPQPSTLNPLQTLC